MNGPAGLPQRDDSVGAASDRAVVRFVDGSGGGVIAQPLLGKAADVWDELRELLGDTTFWVGIRQYTSEHFGRSVTSDDFRASLEKASGRDLCAFFDRWVYQ